MAIEVKQPRGNGWNKSRKIEVGERTIAIARDSNGLFNVVANGKDSAGKTIHRAKSNLTWSEAKSFAEKQISLAEKASSSRGAGNTSTSRT